MEKAMNQNADVLFRAAMALPIQDRLALAERLFESVDQDDVDMTWAVEIKASVGASSKGPIASAEEGHRRLPR